MGVAIVMQLLIADKYESESSSYTSFVFQMFLPFFCFSILFHSFLLSFLSFVAYDFTWGSGFLSRSEDIPPVPGGMLCTNQIPGMLELKVSILPVTQGWIFAKCLQSVIW